MKRFLAMLLATTCACSDGARRDSDSGPDGAASHQQACTRVSHARCEWMTRCSAGDDAGCAARAVADKCAALAGESVKSVEAGRLKFEPGQTDACVAALAALACGEKELPAPCAAIFAGQVGTGGACYADFECGGGSFCSPATCPGVCTQEKAVGSACDDNDRCAGDATCMGGKCARPAGIGAPCGADTASCIDSAYCSSGKCAALLAKDAVCDPSAQRCAQGLSCRVASPGADSGTCQPKVGAGEPCGSSFDCASGLACLGLKSSAFGECGPYKALGDSCRFGMGECQSPNHCSKTTARCTAPETAGTPCGEQESGVWRDAVKCADGLFCAKDKTCTPKAALGSPCERSGCKDSYCKLNPGSSAGVCSPFLAPGQPCDSNEQCESWCVEGMCAEPERECLAP